MIEQRPSNIWHAIECSDYPVYPHNLTVLYELINTRSNGGTGQWRLIYEGQHANETLSGGDTDRFLSADVDVQELFNDMGSWVMASNWGRNRWGGKCARLTNLLKVVWGVSIYGNLLQVEPPPPPDCPSGWAPDGDGCVSRDGPTGDPNGGGGGGPWQPPPYACTWYEYTYWNWSGGVWRPLYVWYECE